MEPDRCDWCGFFENDPYDVGVDPEGSESCSGCGRLLEVDQ